MGSGSLGCGQTPSSVIICTPFSNNFFSEMVVTLSDKFYIQPPGIGGIKVCSDGHGHMTKMTAMPIYGKNANKSSSPELLG